MRFYGWAEIEPFELGLNRFIVIQKEKILKILSKLLIKDISEALF